MEEKAQNGTEYAAAVITVSDKGFGGLREDLSGEQAAQILTEQGWRVTYRSMVPDEAEKIQAELVKCADVLRIPLIVTTGGTGFAKRDVTPEATLAVIEKTVPGIPEAMRAESLKKTPMGMLSRGTAGIRGASLVVNLPGSPQAVEECLEAVIGSLGHGIAVLLGETAECGNASASKAPAVGATGKVLAVCSSPEKKTVKKERKEAFLEEGYGVKGDAHGGNWHRQVSLLSQESVEYILEQAGNSALGKHLLEPGVFAENLRTAGLDLKNLPIGAVLKIGATALGEVTQIGKECHKGCVIREITGECIMPREGIFLRVLRSGMVKPGDEIVYLG